MSIAIELAITALFAINAAGWFEAAERQFHTGTWTGLLAYTAVGFANAFMFVVCVKQVGPLL